MDGKEFDEVTKAAVAALSPFLRGRPPEIQGLVLAWVTAWWLAGHFDPEDTTGLREILLQMHTKGIRELVPIAEREILDKVN